MRLMLRRYESEEDYWRIRAFLREVFLLNGRQELSWQVARLDYWRWHVVENCQVCPAIEEVTYLWETPDGRIAAVLNPEGRGDVHLQVHPGLGTAELEEEMIALAEERLTTPLAGGGHRLQVWARQHDSRRREILARRGFAVGDWPEYNRQRQLDAVLPEPQPVPGYTVRPLGGVEELPARGWASWRGFHEGEPDDRYEGWEWYLNLQRIPLYRRDLDIVAVTSTGEIAAFCTIWYDDVVSHGLYGAGGHGAGTPAARPGQGGTV